MTRIVVVIERPRKKQKKCSEMLLSNSQGIRCANGPFGVWMVERKKQRYKYDERWIPIAFGILIRPIKYRLQNEKKNEDKETQRAKLKDKLKLT